ncbi:MAG: calcium:proton exchanger [Lachnospiraceae bacterium]
MDRRQKKVSYIKKPLAKRSFLCIGFTAAGLIFLIASLILGIKGQGNAGLNAGACGLCSIIMSVLALWYALLSFAEKEKNYILARIGVCISGVIMILWICMMIIGMKG